MGLGNFLKGAVQKGAKVVVSGAKAVASVAKNPVVAAAKVVIDTYNAIKDYAHEQKAKREEKRRKDSQKLDENIQESKKQVQKKADRNAQRFAESMGDETVDIENASANEIRRITNELNDMQELFISQAESIEDDIISYVKSAVHETISEFEEINTQDFAGATLNLNISYLKSCETDVESMIKGSIKNAVRRNLSIDNKKCKAVFNTSGKNAKQQAMNQLQIQIYSNAVKSLWTVINDTISVQNASVFTQIQNRLNAIELNVNESIRQLKEIEHTKKLGEEELKKKQAELQSMIDISAWCIAQLNQEVSI